MSEKEPTGPSVRVWGTILVVAALALIGMVAAIWMPEASESSESSAQADTVASQPSPEQAFMDKMNAQSSILYSYGYDEPQMIEDAYDVCTDWRNGNGFFDIATSFTFLSGFDAGYITSAATWHLCPEYYHLIPED